MILKGFPFALIFICLAPCVRLYGLLWPFTGLLQLAVPVCIVQWGFSPCLALYHGNMATFISGVNIHMSIHFTTVTR
nr:MAG TPA: hypothetical protein [Caudoviricetes sp.]